MLPPPCLRPTSLRRWKSSVKLDRDSYRNKAKSILGASRTSSWKTLAAWSRAPWMQLLTLPGVARKTANVVLGSAFDLNEGMVVDTHISRLSQRLQA